MDFLLLATNKTALATRNTMVKFGDAAAAAEAVVVLPYTDTLRDAF